MEQCVLHLYTQNVRTHSTRSIRSIKTLWQPWERCTSGADLRLSCLAMLKRSPQYDQVGGIVVVSL